MKERVVLSWSGGKDCTLALHALLQSERYEVAALLTTVTETYERVSIHGVRQALIAQQAAALGMRLHTMHIPRNASNETYEASFQSALQFFKAEGIRKVAFGDLYLEDIRAYRTRLLTTVGMEGLFPLWHQDTAELASSFITRGFQALVVCVDSQVLDRTFAGREFDQRLLAALPPGVDPCGENGEFHTFVYGGPPFQHPVGFRRGDVVLRDARFYYCDVLPI